MLPEGKGHVRSVAERPESPQSSHVSPGPRTSPPVPARHPWSPHVTPGPRQQPRPHSPPLPGLWSAEGALSLGLGKMCTFVSHLLGLEGPSLLGTGAAALSPSAILVRSQRPPTVKGPPAWRSPPQVTCQLNGCSSILCYVSTGVCFPLQWRTVARSEEPGGLRLHRPVRPSGTHAPRTLHRTEKEGLRHRPRGPWLLRMTPARCRRRPAHRGRWPRARPKPLTCGSAGPTAS